MFEHYIERTTQNIIAALDAGAQYVRFVDIERAPQVDDAYKNYFTAEVRWWIYEEQMQRRNNPLFDLQTEAIAPVLAGLDELYFQNARFDLDNLKKVTASAVKTRINLLVRPRTTYKWFIFRGEPTKQIEEIRLRLAYLSDYDYLRVGFLDWLAKNSENLNDRGIVSVPQFERTIETIDNDAIFDISPTQFVELLDPLFRFFNEDEEFSDETEIPAESIIIFLNDKGIFKISEKFQKSFVEDNLVRISKRQVLEMIYEVIEETEQEPVMQPVPEIIEQVEEPEPVMQPVPEIIEQVDEPEPVMQPIDEIMELVDEPEPVMQPVDEITELVDEPEPVIQPIDEITEPVDEVAPNEAGSLDEFDDLDSKITELKQELGGNPTAYSTNFDDVASPAPVIEPGDKNPAPAGKLPKASDYIYDYSKRINDYAQKQDYEINDGKSSFYFRVPEEEKIVL